MYYNGQYVSQSYSEAAKWYEMAAEQGCAYAQFNLGAMYENGIGVQKNSEIAKKYFRLAKKNGDDKIKSLLEGIITD